MLPFRRGGLLPVLVAVAMALARDARAESAGRLAAGLLPSGAEAGEGLDISAEFFSGDQQTGWLTARDNVVVRHGDTELRADRVRLNRVTGEVIAEGHGVLVRRDQGTTRFDRLVYNYKTGEGLSSAVDLRARAYRVRAEAARRRPDGTFSLEEAVITTCTNAPGHEHYHVFGREATLKPEDYVAARGVAPHFLGLPFFYFPSWRKELDEHYGWRFQPGYESDWGAYLLSAYKFRLLNFGDGDRLNSKTHFDFRTERGGAVGQDLAWRIGPPGQDAQGFVSCYFLADERPMHRDLDRDPNRDDVEENRYRFTLRHDAVISPRDLLMVRASYLSDSYVFEDFYLDEYRALRQPENFATHTHTGDGYSAGIGAYNRLNDFYESVNRLPEAWADIQRTEMGVSRVYYESQTRGGWLQREFADYGNPSNTPAASYDTLRIDTRHAFYTPHTLFGFLSIVPRAVYRGTYYGNTRREQLVSTPDPVGGTNILQNGLVDAGSGLRSLFELGLETSFKAYGIYEDAAGRFRHVVEPYFNYTLIPEPNLRPGELYRFDAVDALDKTHNVRFGTRQQIQRKTPVGVRTPLDVDLYAIYAFETADDDSGLQTIGVDSRFRPADGISVQVDATYDAEADELDTVNTWLTLWNTSIWEVRGEYYYRSNESSLFAGSLVYALSDAWSFKVYSRYEAETSRLEEQGGYLQYQFDCIAFRLNGRYVPGFTRSDGTERRDDYRISLNVWLRAFPPQRVEGAY